MNLLDVTGDVSFAVELFCCIVMLAWLAVKSRDLELHLPKASYFRIAVLFSLGWLASCFVASLPLGFKTLGNIAYLIQALFYLPLGSVIYDLTHSVFARHQSKIVRALSVSAYAVYWACFFAVLLLFQGAFENFIFKWNAAAGCLFLFLPCVIASFNCFLLRIETGRSKEGNFLLYTSVLLLLFVLLSLASDVVVPYFLNGRVDLTTLWRKTPTCFAIFLLALFFELSYKATYQWQSKIVFMLARSVGDGVFIYSRSGRILFANPAAKTLLKSPHENFVGKNIRDILNLNDEALFVEHASQHSEIIVGDGKETLLHVVFKDLGLFDTKSFVLLLSRNFEREQGYSEWKATLLREQLEQQAKLQNMEAEIRRKETLLMTLLNNLPMEISAKNSAGVVILQNRLDEERNGKLLGMTEQEWPEAERRAFAGVQGTFENIVYTEGKSSIKSALNYTYLPVAEESGKNMVLKICRDITDSLNLNLERMRLLENEKRRMHLEDLGTLTGGLAHEFNNILGAQLGFCALAKSVIPQDSPAKKYLEQIEIAGTREKELIEKLLVHARAEMEHEEHSEFMLAGLVLNSLGALRSSIPQNIRLETPLAGSDVKLQGSESALRQILSNLFNNAVYAMREKGGVLSVSAKSIYFEKPQEVGSPWEIPAGDFVCIAVSDTGEGIPSNVMQRLFSPLFTTKPPGEGLGLGLFACVSLAKAAHGAITVQSTVGKGSTFKVYWPLAGKGVNNG